MDRFVEYYNTVRPHRSLGRRTPVESFQRPGKGSPERARRSTSRATGYGAEKAWTKSGTVTLRHEGKFLHIGIGRAYAGWRVLMLVAGKKVIVLGAADRLVASPAYPRPCPQLPAPALTRLSTMS